MPRPVHRLANALRKAFLVGWACGEPRVRGRITSLRYYEDSRKWVFTLAAAGGNFYVECSSPQAAPALALGSQVMITGSLFSRRTRSGCDSGSICAREVLAVGNGENQE